MFFSRKKLLIVCGVVGGLGAFLVHAYHGGVAQSLDQGISAKEKGDYQTAVSQLRPIAEHGNVRAQLELGRIYRGISNNQSPPADLKEAEHWLRLAAEHGDPAAQTELGTLYQYALSPFNEPEALKWYRKAAAQGYPRGESALAGILQFGVAVPRDFDEATKWELLAAEQGDAGAQIQLISDYEHGILVPKDVAKAAEWERRCAEQNVPACQYSFALRFINADGVPQDFVQAMKWLRQDEALQKTPASKAQAEYQMAQLYANGQGVPQDYAAAIDLYRQSASNGGEGGMELAVIYGFGKGVGKDCGQAIEWWRKSRHPPASLDLQEACGAEFKDEGAPEMASRTSLPLKGDRFGMDGAIAIFEDARISEDLREAMWGSFNHPLMALDKDDDDDKAEYAEFSKKNAADADLRLVSSNGSVEDHLPLGNPLADVNLIDLGATAAPIFAVTSDGHIGMGPYTGFVTTFVSVIDGKLKKVESVNDDTNETAVISLTNSLWNHWEVVGAAGAKEIIYMHCFPNFGADGGDPNKRIAITYSTFRYDEGHWHVKSREASQRGCPEEEMPDRVEFP